MASSAHGARGEYERTLREYYASKAEYARLKQPGRQEQLRPMDSRRGKVRLGLVSRRGPLSFCVCELSAPETSFDVRIGETHRCSCSSSRCCDHIHWVLTAVLRVKASTACRTGLSKLELTQAVEAAPPTQVATPHSRLRSKPRPELDGESVSWLLGLSEYEAYLLTLPPLKDEPNDTGRPIAIDDSCPICMDAMTPQEAQRPGVLVYCKGSCRRSMHAECLRAWAQHQPGTLSCPMCRAAWGDVPPSIAEAEAEVATRKLQRELREGLAAVGQRQALMELEWRKRMAGDKGESQVHTCNSCEPISSDFRRRETALVPRLHMPRADGQRFPAVTGSKTAAGGSVGGTPALIATTRGANVPQHGLISTLASSSLQPRRVVPAVRNINRTVNNR
ncbi:hypothetical protein AB1Y20_015551 [Prymnesium parvum]|uniref:Anaphase-promoting complex subunit 11 n=1 Tax=Prymnesium parvum TaxID=97485 RepID=A0AB34JY76_PRYPA